MMKGKISGFLLIALTLFPAPALAVDKISARIEQFLTVIDSNPSYLMSQHYDFLERETILVEKLCGDDVHIPQRERKLCEDIKDQRLSDSSEAPSLLLLWLGEKLPKKPIITIIKNEHRSKNHCDIITAKLNNIVIVFEIYDINLSYNPMVVRSINGKPLVDIIDKDIKDGLSVSSLLKKTKE